MQEKLWHLYAKIWLQTGAQRVDGMSVCLAEDIVYRDPQISAEGVEAFADYITGFQQDYPGCGFRIRQVSHHNDRSLADWDCVTKEGEVLFQGRSFAVVNKQGKFTELNGFYPVEGQDGETPEPGQIL